MADPTTPNRAPGSGPSWVVPDTPEISLRTPTIGGKEPPVRLTSHTPSSSPTGLVSRRRDAPKPSLPADGGRARDRTAGGRLAVRAEVGRLSRGDGEPERRARGLEPERAAVASLLSGAPRRRRAAAARLGARRRDRDRA